MHNQHTHTLCIHTHACMYRLTHLYAYACVHMYAGILLLHSCIIYVCTPSAVHAQFEAMYLYTYMYIYVCIRSCIKLFNLMNAKSMCGGPMEFVQIWAS